MLIDRRYRGRRPQSQSQSQADGEWGDDLPDSLRPVLPLRQDIAIPAMLRDATGRAILVVYMPSDRNGDERQEAVEAIARWVMARLNGSATQRSQALPGANSREQLEALCMASLLTTGSACGWSADRCAAQAVAAADALERARADRVERAERRQ